jgi:DNA-binding response OmpR family regulator
VTTTSYDLVFMDIQMPGMDGVTATRRIRSLAAPAREVTIVAMTANVLPEQVRGFLDAGIDGHIGKPVRRDELLRRLDEWLPRAEGPHLAPEGAARAAPPLNEKGFEDFRAMFGPERVHQWLERLDEHLRDTFAGENAAAMDRHRIAREAHATIPQAALLGFSELAESCTALERACAYGGDVAAALESVCRAAREARRAIATLDRVALT